MESRYREYATHRHHSGAVGFGVVIVIVGALLLLNNLGIFPIRDIFRYWPVALIALGLVKALDARDARGQVGGGVIVLVGAWLLADRLDLSFFPFHFHQFWPILLIGLGVLLILKHGDRQTYTGPDGVNTSAVFAGGKRQVTGEFTGGKMEVVFGGYEVDLRQALLTANEAVFQLHVVFGGIEIAIPETWDVSIEGKAVFGGFEDKTRHPLPGTPGAKRLILGGEVVFGGVTVKN
jgi:predicted membrane protein